MTAVMAPASIAVVPSELTVTVWDRRARPRDADEGAVHPVSRLIPAAPSEATAMRTPVRHDGAERKP